LVFSSGVAKKTLKKGTGSARPLPDDRVTLHYSSWKRDGTLTDSSRLRDDPVVQSVRQLFPGLAEAVGAMTEGERCRVWVPGALTFPPDAERPPANDALTLDVELLAIKRAPPVPPLTAPEGTPRTELGLGYQFLERGNGAGPPAPSARVTFLHSGWSATTGALVESSELAERPQSSLMSALLPGLREALLRMRVGDRARLWVPTTLAYGEKPRRRAPAGPLVFELQLLKIE
jgi:peptidylprolyl isomerase